ncbi:hypothetical protein J4464_04580 [Candidatus Woesearchaeota archaeon]|nr:hypothetical protein [Candidatus Woesearchaeota archaeon]
MADVSTFRGILIFFDRLGIYDVILPFLLVFSIMFAILEKTKVFGTEKIGDHTYTRKNMNAMVAFVIGFMVIASAHLVALITEASANMVILLMLAVFFLLLVGSFMQEKPEGVILEGKWKIMFMVIMFVGIIGIFLHAIRLPSGQPFLEWLLQYIAYNFNSAVVGSIILMLVVIGFMYFIVRDRKVPEKT